jgi:asparagine synthase (glutamine-hydrolysing)
MSRSLEAQYSGEAADVEELDALLRDAVARRMAADVPVGAFLSGGIDSSLITAMMTGCSPDRIRSFAIGFSARPWDEAPFASAVAGHLGTLHEELHVTSAHALDIVQDLPTICDEPFADDSIVPTVLLSRMARRHVTVALSGDGGDELFAGYERYAAIDRWLARCASLPAPIRALAGSEAGGLHSLSAHLGGDRLERRLHLLSQLLVDGDPERFGELIMSQVFDPNTLLSTPRPANLAIDREVYGLGRSGPIDRMTFLDTNSSLVDDILTKVDRASMSTSLEVRCPLLDHRVIELSWRFPAAAKYRDGTGKLPLRTLLYRHVPRALVDRPKQGFGAPVQLWLRQELRDWAEALMSREALSRHGLLNVNACRELWEDFAHRGRGWSRVLWNLLMFQAWYEFINETKKRAADAAHRDLERHGATPAAFAAGC